MVPQWLRQTLARLEPGAKYYRLPANGSRGTAVSERPLGESDTSKPLAKLNAIWHDKRTRFGFIASLLLLLVFLAFGSRTVSF